MMLCGLVWFPAMAPRRGLEPSLKHQLIVNKTIYYDSDIYLRSTHVPHRKAIHRRYELVMPVKVFSVGYGVRGKCVSRAIVSSFR